jgi:hypothetical protein
MKTALLGIFLLTATAAVQAQVGQDVKNAGHDTKDAATDAAHDTSTATKKAGHKTAHGVKKGTHKAAAETEKGADNVRNKTADTSTK